MTAEIPLTSNEEYLLCCRFEIAGNSRSAALRYVPVVAVLLTASVEVVGTQWNVTWQLRFSAANGTWGRLHTAWPRSNAVPKGPKYKRNAEICNCTNHSQHHSQLPIAKAELMIAFLKPSTQARRPDAIRYRLQPMGQTKYVTPADKYEVCTHLSLRRCLVNSVGNAESAGLCFPGL